MDTGASDMVNSVDFFSTISSQFVTSVELSNGELVSVTHKGTVKVLIN